MKTKFLVHVSQDKRFSSEVKAEALAWASLHHPESPLVKVNPNVFASLIPLDMQFILAAVQSGACRGFLLSLYFFFLSFLLADNYFSFPFLQKCRWPPRAPKRLSKPHSPATSERPQKLLCQRLRRWAAKGQTCLHYETVK